MNSEEDLIDIDLESLTTKPNRESKENRRNASSTLDLDLDDGDDYDDNDDDSPFNHIFASSNKVKRGSLGFDDDKSTRLFAAINTTNDLSLLTKEVSKINQEEVDDIPFIPDLDDLDDIHGVEEEDLPNMVVSSLVNMQELDMNVEKRNNLSEIEGIDISLLSSRLLSSKDVEEDDEPWTWESLLSQVTLLVSNEEIKL